MRVTLKDLRKELGLLDGQVFDANLQDRLSYHLLKRRGYEHFMAGKIGTVELGERLAQEWASLPLLAPANGNTRGESYYDGDGLNKSLTTPETIEALLDKPSKIGARLVIWYRCQHCDRTGPWHKWEAEVIWPSHTEGGRGRHRPC